MAGGKVAFVMGDDCHEKKTMENKVVKVAAKAASAYKNKGYKVLSMYGSAERSAAVNKELIKTPGVGSRALTQANIEKYIESEYKKPCGERADELMLNFVAHGSYNGGNHSICGGGSASTDGGRRKNQIYVKDVAAKIKALQIADKCPNKIKIAVVDFSCKSGGSVKAFKGLGCTLAMTSSLNSANRKVLDKYVESINSPAGTKMSDIHLDLLVNREYDLVKEKKDKANPGKTLIERTFDNANQIGGCSDQQFGNINAHNKVTPMCRTAFGVLDAKRKAEYKTIQNILKGLKLKSDIDKSSIAKAMDKPLSEIPAADQLDEKVNELIQKDTIATNKLKNLIAEESHLLSHPIMDKPLTCKFNANALVDPNFKKVFSPTNEDQYKVSMMILEDMCLSLYPVPERITDGDTNNSAEVLAAKNKCKPGKSGSIINIKTKGLKLTVAEMIRLDKKFNYQMNKDTYADLKDNTFSSLKRLRKSTVGKKHVMTLKRNNLRDAYLSTLSKCMKKAETLGNEDVSKAVAFVKKNYVGGTKQCENGQNKNKLVCGIKAMEDRSDNIKQYLGMARGYYFLQCKGNINRSNDLKACDEFAI